MKRRLAVIAAVAVTAWMLVLAGQRTLLAPGAPAESRTSVVTQAEFERIRPGMSYQDCVRAIGSEGTPFGSSAAPVADGPWPEWISFVWRNDPDSYIMVSYRNGEVERARAFNLK